jgi:toxin ParE1/3/4
MAYRVTISPIASKNIEDALAYYRDFDDKKIALAFLKDFKSVYKALRINPFYQFHDNNYRFIPFKKFPCIAFFLVDETTKNVFLNAVFHTSQNPDKYFNI